MDLEMSDSQLRAPRALAADAVAWHTEIAARFDSRYEKSASFKERLAVWRDLITRYGGPKISVLDAGCGSGVFTVEAARRCRAVVGFDASSAMLEIAKRRTIGESNVALHQARLPDLGFLDGQIFDLIISSSVLEYLDDPWRAVDALTAHLAANGVLLLSVPNGDSLHRKAEALAYRFTGRPRYYAHVQYVPKASAFKAGLVERGFQIETLQYYGPAPVLSGLGRPFGLSQSTDTLFVLAARKAPLA
jgi:SAM-dependent methyltransferase